MVEKEISGVLQARAEERTALHTSCFIELSCSVYLDPSRGAWVYRDVMIDRIVEHFDQNQGVQDLFMSPDNATRGPVGPRDGLVDAEKYLHLF